LQNNLLSQKHNLLIDTYEQPTCILKIFDELNWETIAMELVNELGRPSCETSFFVKSNRIMLIIVKDKSNNPVNFLQTPLQTLLLFSLNVMAV
jgi:hypothetical protein